MTIVHAASRTDQLARYLEIRRTTEELCRPLAIEDYVLQAMPDVSPAKWHLAHVSWFFETFLLTPHLPGYEPLDPAYTFLFNSYYNGVGPQFSRPARGHLSRPTVADVYAYRAWVDRGMERLLAAMDIERAGAVAALVELGLNHEQQHQELILTDIKYNLAVNPLHPAYHATAVPRGTATAPLAWRELRGGLVPIGYDGAGFAFDNEGPRHTVYLRPFRLADRPTTNGEYLEFIDAGGYRTPGPWLSEGWRAVQERGWQAPLYWERQDGSWWTQTLSGFLPLDLHSPVTHVSYYEADAYARWRGARLPTEPEWEHAAARLPIGGNLQERGIFHPLPATSDEPLAQLFGDVWEWTQSAYAPYPGYRTEPGAVGEYNGKFMVSQLVLRGGSCVTPASHIRASYRNFFPPDARWQFSGIRLAEDA
ncbi:MAG TPA: ergothioneine biosynthesis protein EgtB [Patescibacteria group bacterium]|jgi:ergothioneine biosynthesis protein EgtB|nr:ergothioneine biosynthesis protein EgtB [Patescibacteria group bacterium]